MTTKQVKTDPHVSNAQWTDPKGNVHQPGETGDYSWVFDLDDLIRDRTVAVRYTSTPASAEAIPAFDKEGEG